MWSLMPAHGLAYTHAYDQMRHPRTTHACLHTQSRICTRMRTYASLYISHQHAYTLRETAYFPKMFLDVFLEYLFVTSNIARKNLSMSHAYTHTYTYIHAVPEGEASASLRVLRGDDTVLDSCCSIGLDAHIHVPFQYPFVWHKQHDTCFPVKAEHASHSKEESCVHDVERTLQSGSHTSLKCVTSSWQLHACEQEALQVCMSMQADCSSDTKRRLEVWKANMYIVSRQVNMGRCAQGFHPCTFRELRVQSWLHAHRDCMHIVTACTSWLHAHRDCMHIVTACTCVLK